MLAWESDSFQPTIKESDLLLGYRNHTISMPTGYPLRANPSRQRQRGQNRDPAPAAAKALGLMTNYVTGDTAYDAEAVLAVIVNEPMPNPLCLAAPAPKKSDHIDTRQAYCPADLPMVHKER
jgi:hypothetical protein